jgi:2-hydroxychromene-2-carboxylate isomerase
MSDPYPEDAIEFWFSTGSTYTYLTVARLHKVAQRAGVRFNWRPFSVRTIMREMNNTPFSGKPVKMNYMWRDIERRAAAYGLPVHVPAPYPLVDFDLANRVALVALRQDWGQDYVRASYRRWFVDGLPAGSEPNLSDSLREVGQTPDDVITAALSDPIDEAYLAATAQARQLGIFGSPSFVTRNEVFWGDDRLDDAIVWHRKGTLAP